MFYIGTIILTLRWLREVYYNSACFTMLEVNIQVLKSFPHAGQALSVCRLCLCTLRITARLPLLLCQMMFIGPTLNPGEPTGKEMRRGGRYSM